MHLSAFSVVGFSFETVFDGLAVMFLSFEV